MAIINICLIEVVIGIYFLVVFNFLINLIELIIFISVAVSFILSIHIRIFEFAVERFGHILLFFLLFVLFVRWLFSLGFFQKHDLLQLFLVELRHTLDEQPLLDLEEDASILPPHHLFSLLLVVLFVF